MGQTIDEIEKSIRSQMKGLSEKETETLFGRLIHNEMIPSKLPVGLDTLRFLDPALVGAFSKELGYAINDCKNRPNLEDPRVVTLKIVVVPVINEEAEPGAELEEVSMRGVVYPVMRPQRKSKPVHVSLLHGKNVAFFRADIPGYNGRTLFDDMEAVHQIPTVTDAK
jgi:hypothetical protein